jgi:hypothetical protein
VRQPVSAAPGRLTYDDSAADRLLEMLDGVGGGPTRQVGEHVDRKFPSDHRTGAERGRPRPISAAICLTSSPGSLLGLPSSPIGADAVLDARAKAEYRARIAVLDQELDAADEAGEARRAAADEAGEARRAAAAAAERQRLIHELTAAAGLAGRSRRLGDETERARKTVTARIHHTIGRLADTHPSSPSTCATRCGPGPVRLHAGQAVDVVALGSLVNRHPVRPGSDPRKLVVSKLAGVTGGPAGHRRIGRFA